MTENWQELKFEIKQLLDKVDGRDCAVLERFMGHIKFILSDFLFIQWEMTHYHNKANYLEGQKTDILAENTALRKDNGGSQERE